MDSNLLRTVLARWASGVVIVTTVREDGGRHGMTASSFASVALDPPLVSVCLATDSATCLLVRASGVFAVNMLGHDHAGIGRRFSVANSPPADRFAQGSWATADTGAPVLTEALAWLDCRVETLHEAGDHTIVLGHVQAAAAPRSAPPLIYHDRTYYEGITR